MLNNRMMASDCEGTESKNDQQPVTRQSSDEAFHLLMHRRKHQSHCPVHSFQKELELVLRYPAWGYHQSGEVKGVCEAILLTVLQVMLPGAALCLSE